ncbi:MAG TPA: hypothetical protein VHB73_01970 [Alphaproteobacteria bacterium]|nr:hypothetical protein [Alphaproteobacteria bacterium]
MRKQALVTHTDMCCSQCQEVLFRITGPEIGSDEVICLGCGGYGPHSEVKRGAGLVGRAITESQMNHLQSLVEATVKQYALHSS